MVYLATARITPEITRKQPMICLAEYVLPKSRAEKISCHTKNDCSRHTKEISHFTFVEPQQNQMKLVKVGINQNLPKSQGDYRSKILLPKLTKKLQHNVENLI
jgi:hypothetical protein